MSMTTAMNNFEDIVNDAYLSYFWTDWSDPEKLNQVWLTSKIGDNSFQNFTGVQKYHNATAATEDLTPLAALPVTFVSPQMGVVAPWFRRLSNYALGLSGFNGAEIQSEYFVPWSVATKAIQALKPLAKEMNALSYVSSFRIIASDDMWMSTANGDNINGEPRSVAIHWSWIPNLSAVMELLPKIEAALAPYNPVPHWGKLFTMDPCSTFLKRYKKLADFVALDKKLDPNGKFHNDFLDNNVFKKCTSCG